MGCGGAQVLCGIARRCGGAAVHFIAEPFIMAVVTGLIAHTTAAITTNATARWDGIAARTTAKAQAVVSIHAVATAVAHEIAAWEVTDAEATAEHEAPGVREAEATGVREAVATGVREAAAGNGEKR